MHVPSFFLFSLAYFGILYLISISLRKYKMPKRDLFEELKSGLEDAMLYEKEKLMLKVTTIMPKERTLVSVEEISSIREIFKPNE